MSELAELTTLTEMTASIEAEQFVLIELWGTHCAPCRSLRPLLEKMADTHTDWSFHALNVDAVPEAAEQFSVRGTPTILLFKDGQESDRTTGFIMPADLTARMGAI